MPKGMLRWHLRNRLAYIRESRGLKQAELAQLVKATRGALAHWESDASRPSDDMIKRLAQVLHCRIHDIFPFE